MAEHVQPGPEELSPAGHGSGRFVIIAVILAVVIIAGVTSLVLFRRAHAAGAEKKGGPGRGPGGPIPAVLGTVQARDFPIYLDGLGTVQAFNTVTVRSRVDGQILKILFSEGQDVHTGDLLAQIDPAPFQAQLDQALARKAEDEAQLAVAKLNLKRNADLLANKI